MSEPNQIPPIPDIPLDIDDNVRDVLDAMKAAIDSLRNRVEELEQQ